LAIGLNGADIGFKSRHWWPDCLLTFIYFYCFGLMRLNKSLRVIAFWTFAAWQRRFVWLVDCQFGAVVLRRICCSQSWPDRWGLVCLLNLCVHFRQKHTKWQRCAVRKRIDFRFVRRHPTTLDRRLYRPFPPCACRKYEMQLLSPNACRII